MYDVCIFWVECSACCKVCSFNFSALKLLSLPENVPAMINCAQGKDRTGMISAMVLGCMGKSKEYIAYDYARSEVLKRKHKTTRAQLT